MLGKMRGREEVRFNKWARVGSGERVVNGKRARLEGRERVGACEIDQVSRLDLTQGMFSFTLIYHSSIEIQLGPVNLTHKMSSFILPPSPSRPLRPTALCAPPAHRG